MATTPEGKVKAKVRALLKKHGLWYFFPANNGYGMSGIPDLICILPGGKFLGIECKADAKKKPTELQTACGAAINTAGGIWMVVCDDESLALLEQTILKHRTIHRIVSR